MQLALLQKPIRRRNADPTIKTFKVQGNNYVDHWLQMKQQLEKHRGHDIAKSKRVPRTTLTDVQQVATYWTDQIKRNALKLAGRHQPELDRWGKALDRIKGHQSTVLPSDVYPDNEQFWLRDTRRIAITLNSLKMQPSEFEMIIGSIVEAVKEAPGRVRDFIDDATPDVSFPSWAKWAALGLVGAAGAALVLPPILGRKK